MMPKLRKNCPVGKPYHPADFPYLQCSYCLGYDGLWKTGTLPI